MGACSGGVTWTFSVDVNGIRRPESHMGLYLLIRTVLDVYIDQDGSKLAVKLSSHEYIDVGNFAAATVHEQLYELRLWHICTYNSKH